MVSDADMNRATDPEGADGPARPTPEQRVEMAAYVDRVAPGLLDALGVPRARPQVRFPKYTVEWSEEDQGFVATCDWFPSMSWIEPDCVMALSKFADMLLEEFGEEGFALQRDYMNAERRGLA